MLAGVGVAEHDLLDFGPRDHDGAIRLAPQHLIEKLACIADLVNRLEQWDKPDTGHTRMEIDQPGFPCECHRRQDVISPSEAHLAQGGDFLVWGMMPVAVIFVCSATALVVVSLVTKPPPAEVVEKFFIPRSERGT